MRSLRTSSRIFRSKNILNSRGAMPLVVPPDHNRSAIKSKKPKVDAGALPPDSAPEPIKYHLQLFVSGTTPKSARAVQNIRAICLAQLDGRYDLEVMDIYQHPELVRAEKIVVTPTLIKKLPVPLRRVIGDLSDLERVLAALDIVNE